MLRIHGIKQCSSMQKAFAWLDAHSLPYEFHDYKKLGVDVTALRAWCAELGWQTLLNTRGTTWRKLAEEDKQDLDEQKAIELMVANPSLIKRPVISGGRKLVVGFDESKFSEALEG